MRSRDRVVGGAVEELWKSEYRAKKLWKCLTRLLYIQLAFGGRMLVRQTANATTVSSRPPKNPQSWPDVLNLLEVARVF